MENSRINILLVEDSQTDAMLVQDELSHALSAVFTLSHVERLSDAIKEIQQKNYDLILLDLYLPDSSGLESIIKLRDTTAKIPIAVLSFRDDDQLALQVIKAGAQDYLVKGNLTEGVLSRVIYYSIERKRAEENTRKAQQRFQTMFEKAPLGIALIDAKTGAFCDANPMYAEIVGRTPEELAHLNQTDITHPDDIDSYLDEMELLNAKKTPSFRISKRIFRPDHSVIWIELSVTPFETDGSANACHLCMIKDISEHKQLVSNLHDLTAHLQNIREDERTRIAREIHDVLGGTLTVLKMDLDWLSKKVVENPMHERIISLHELAGEAIETARRVSLNLRPNVLDNLGLIGAVEWLIREFEQRLDIKCQLNTNFSNHDRINKKCETSIFRIVQEVFTNITRHAEATDVVVNIEEIDNQLFIEISDNGIGITEQQLFNPKSFGIIGMYERTEQLGGKLRIQGEAVKGCTIELTIPLQQHQSIDEPIT